MEHVEPSCEFRSVASLDDEVEEEGMMDGGGGDDGDEDKLHQVSVISWMDVNETAEACERVLVLFRHMQCKYEAEDVNLDTVAYGHAFRVMVHLKQNSCIDKYQLKLI